MKSKMQMRRTLKLLNKAKDEEEGKEGRKVRSENGGGKTVRTRKKKREKKRGRRAYPVGV